MALEAVIYPQQPQHPFAYVSIKDLLNYNNNNNNNNFINLKQQDQKGSINTFLDNQTEKKHPYEESSMLMPQMNVDEGHVPYDIPISLDQFNTNKLVDNSTTSSKVSRPKRRRVKSRKNKEEIENQRMTHIAVERNRRKQMNEYLSLLRSLMPESYVQRVDQASIVGGAINFVKELEQRLQFLGAKKEKVEGKSDASTSIPFSDFFTFPQYSTSASFCENSLAMNEQMSEVKCGIADIEVAMMETHANLKIRSKKRPKQLLKIISSLHVMHLTVLHLNVNTSGEIALYCLSVKVEDDCNLRSVDEIAAAVYQILTRIQEEAMLNN